MHTPIKEQLLKAFPIHLRKRVIIQEIENLPAPAASAITDCGKILILFSEPKLHEVEKQGVDIKTVGIHELYHYLFNHLELNKDKKLDPKRLNIACDCEINSFIPALKREPFAFPEAFRLPPKQTWNWYLDKLPKDIEQQQSLCSMGLTEEEKKQLGKILKEEMEKRGFKAGTGQKEPIDTKPREIKRIPRGLTAALERNIQQSCHNRFEKALTFSKPHKWKDDGTPGRKRIKGPKLAFCIDCSGSTTGEQQKQYYGLVRRMLKEYEATVIEFDDGIRHVGKKPTCKEWGGGTSFKEPQALVEKGNFDAVVWFTDGEGEWTKKSNRVQYLYLFTGHNKSILPTQKYVIEYK